MAYVCPNCGKKTKLPGLCCGDTMAQEGTFYCDKCKKQSDTQMECCGTIMRQL